MLPTDQLARVKVTETEAVAEPSRIAAMAERRLHSNSYPALRKVQCAYHDGVLTLRGCLPRYYLKQLAQAAVAPIEGVQRINNQIEVTSPAERATEEPT